MIGLDTNVLVRYITQDDKKQSAKASKLIEGRLTVKQPGYITLITLVEIVRVLESCYQQPKNKILDVINGLLTTKQLVIERADMVYLAMKIYRTAQADFSDAMISIIATNDGCGSIVTFDKKAMTVGMTLL